MAIEPAVAKVKTLAALEAERAELEQEAYDEKNKLLNQSQFQELLDLQTDEEPDFVEEIVEMYITDAKDMLKELDGIFSETTPAVAPDSEEPSDDKTPAPAPKPDYNLARAVLHKLKGSSSTFGADGVQQKCEELREHCINEVFDKCREGEGSLAQLQENVDNLSEFLAKYTAKTKEIHEMKTGDAAGKAEDK
mmetsp:Transcript_18169/g.29031  ORF Transcript_18169/g.29031 Transcript_18169/m.29031 type:complete len:193 (+) Transcript_18169:304-882(+)|eukprot:CAMPEP_0198687656 /NCGR_PEP_ID=MMETSP1468-20131203/70453_1 /TAXON_ID=1461545 /ORGANISM="Mantoniella sp, Strain CCMP1436" /LENGTH=192 /DNA_ID=CAMNT_0044435955 /DNA_START=285 /DNA_END=863 /DNA_ORIENTATION=+